MTTQSRLSPFHLAIPVDDLKAAQYFYHEILGCPIGRSCDQWIDFDFYGHQLVTHLSPDECAPAKTNRVDGDEVPCRHYGMVLDWNDWEDLSVRLKIYLEKIGQNFIIAPHIRFKNGPGEQGTFFIYDPAGNALEFKCFRDLDQLFVAE